jgi:hypothetical protein
VPKVFDHARDFGAVLGLGHWGRTALSFWARQAGSRRPAASPAAFTASGEVLMRNGKGMRWLALAASLLVAACSDAGSPVEPSGAQLASVQATTNRARHEELQRAREEQKAYFKQMKEANRENLRAAREEWKAWKADWKEQYKLQKEAWKRAHPGEKGGPEIQLLRCEPRDYEAAAEIIGPQGGTIKVGEHQLVIPAGALAQEELIVAEAPTSSLVDVNFGPHGLQFARSARLTLSYKGCVRPTSSDLRVAYIQGNQILELPPSLDRKADDEVDAEIDHFSRYAVAW